jgi:hypothetical protein
VAEGRDELSRLLGQTFGRKKKRPQAEGVGLGSYGGNFDSSRDVPTEGQVPGIIYQGGQPRSDKYASVFAGADKANCPPWLTPDCLDVFSRLLEQTFRNFQLGARPPSHVAPPFVADCIDVYQKVTIPATPSGAPAFVDVACFQVPQSRRRGEIVCAGHAVEDPTSWSDLEWRLTFNGAPIDHYTSILFQLFEWLPLSKICLPHMVSDDKICFQARSISGAGHVVFARLFGWHYPVRAESGSRIASTIVD